MEDGEIIELYWERQERAIEASHTKYGAYCYSVASHILSSHEDCEECVNDTWLRAWSAMPPQRPTHLRLFFAKITRNLSFDRFKHEHAAKRYGGTLDSVFEELEECTAGTGNVEDALQQKELAAHINAFLHTLPERECSIFLWRYFYVRETAEIADRYQLKESHVLVILSRTRAKLRRYLEKEGYVL
ncbi:MAG: RNA polymerase sigma factor [Roseburia sp.]